MIRIALAGAGRMAQAIATLAASTADTEIGSVWSRHPGDDRFGNSIRVSDDLDSVVAAGDVTIDFSLPAATAGVAAAAARAGKPLVCGVSGLGDSEMNALRAAAQQVAVVYDRNMSLGIAVLADLVRRAAGVLGEDFSVSVRETHHVHKKDAPSGTALMLGEQLGSRPVEFAVERRGEVPGDHDVEFCSATESLRLSHSVTTRDVFAAGAIRAARFASRAAPGWYAMRDVLDAH